MIRDYLLFSFNSLRARKIRSWLTMIGIFIGIAAVVALIGLGEGLRGAINSQFSFLGADILAVTASGGFGPPGTGVANPLTEKELGEIKKTMGIEGAAGRLLEPVKLVFSGKSIFTHAATLPEGKDRKIMEYAMNLKSQKGRGLEDNEKGAVFLGSAFIEDSPFEKTIMPGAKVRIEEKEFRVVGIMEKKGNLGVDGSVFLNEEDLREIAGREGDDYDIIVSRFDKNADVGKIKAEIEKRLRRVRNVDEGEEDFSVETPSSIMEAVNSSLLAVQIFVYIIAGISLLVGGIGIMNTMYTSVVERTKEIGIMKSIGARNSAIFGIFFIESGLLGMTGGAIGAVIGFSAAKGLAFVGRAVLGSELIAAHISPALIIGSLLFAFVLGSFFGILPALQASKLNPVDALRYLK